MTDKLEALSQPVVWGLFEFSSNKLYHSMQDKLDAENYLNQVHQSNDSITLNIEPLYSQEYVTALLAENAELKASLSEWEDCKHDGATYHDMSGRERCGRCGADL
jgi:uncharacterized protein YdeI (YjbR/CyaY-like superfamily)